MKKTSKAIKNDKSIVEINFDKATKDFISKYDIQEDFKATKCVDFNRLKGIIFVVDTETVGNVKVKDTVFPFDISIIVLEIHTQKVLCRICFIDKGIFRDKHKSTDIYYQKNIPFYKQEIEKNKEEFFELSAYGVLKELNKLWREYKPICWGAYNSDFDSNAIANAYKLYPQLKNPFVRTKEFDIQAIMVQFLIDFPNHKEAYKITCQYLREYTDKGNLKLTAEMSMRYFLTFNLIEQHTGLSDASLESELLLAIMEIYKEYGIPCVVYFGKRWRSYNHILYNEKFGGLLKPLKDNVMCELLKSITLSYNRMKHGVLETMKNDKARQLANVK